MTEDEFRALAVDEGYVNFRSVRYEPGNRPELHAHDVSAKVLLLEGTFAMGYADDEMTLGVGDTCEVPAGTLHSERTGAEGATVLLATT